MQVAYLILAHNEPELLKRLVNRLDHPGAYFYIHFDTKFSSLSLQEFFSSRDNVKIISKYSIFWMGFRMIEATIELLSMAYSTRRHKYYVLLSGQDYPVKSNEYIYDFLSKTDKDFIDFNRVEDHRDNIREKLQFYHFYDNPLYNPRAANRNKFFVWLYFGLHKKLSRFLPRRRFYKDMKPYFGPQWFILSHDTVGYVLSFIRENPGYMKFMKYTEGPDEIFFPTIILNSPRIENVAGYEAFSEWLKTRADGTIFIHQIGSHKFMDWSVSPGPAVLDLGYFEHLSATNKLFARKFSTEKSAALLDKIDKDLLGLK
jgi:hypothetical protein